jgi:hypothetical protein
MKWSASALLEKQMSVCFLMGQCTDLKRVSIYLLFYVPAKIDVERPFFGDSVWQKIETMKYI